jgi:hypothetical protein
MDWQVSSIVPAKQQRPLERKLAYSQLLHLHKALNSLGGDHSVANLQLDEPDWENATKECPESEADKPPIRSHFDKIEDEMF